MKTVTKISPGASPGARGANGSFHSPKSGLEFLLAAPLWGSQSVFSNTQFVVDIEKRILVPLEQKLNILWARATESFQISSAVS